HQSLSDDEKTTVAKVQERLPNICAPMGDPMHEEDVAFCTERCAIRYLRACRWDADMAVERIGNTLKWRHERRPHVMDPAYVEPEAMNGKLVIDGFDYCGGPVLYITPRLESTKSSQRQVDTMIFFLERAIALMPPGVEKLTFIVDFGGSSVFNSPAPWVTKSIVHTLDQHYPERLHMAILVGTPWYYNQIFKLISAMIDPVTKEKMRVVELSRHKRKTSVVDNNNTNDGNMVPPELLHRSVGGQFPFTHDHSVYWERLLE
ncbi:CRAL-TRIO domain-containing protein, partial [Syncephalis plumigaleata]